MIRTPTENTVLTQLYKQQTTSWRLKVKTEKENRKVHGFVRRFILLIP